MMKRDFLIAIKLLTEGRCEEIRPVNGTSHYYLDGTYIQFSREAKDFLGEWEIIGYKPKMVEVAVKRWVIHHPNGGETTLRNEADLEKYQRAGFPITECFGKRMVQSHEED